MIKYDIIIIIIYDISEAKNIGLINAAPTGMGLLTPQVCV